MRIVRFVDDCGIIRWGTPTGAGTAAILAGPPGASPPEVTSRIVVVRRVLAPVNPPNIFGIGKNYAGHVSETLARLPDAPVVFMKPTTAIANPHDAIRIPRVCQRLPEVDFEGELAVVIGRVARDVSESDALGHVLGYACANDVTARRWQRDNGGQWIRGKGFDSFCPVGPCLVTSDEIPNPQLLMIRTHVNGVLMQEASTGMLFPVARIISFLSQDTTLAPGTLILTGTPAGVGFTRDPPVFLEPGDRVVVSIEGIGCLENSVEHAAECAG